jgi:diguanylate cyclase (GGDEF)-like protein
MSGFRSVKPSPDHPGLVCLAFGRDGELQWRNTAAQRLGAGERKTPRGLVDLVHTDDRAVIEVMLRTVRDQGWAAETVRVQDSLTGALRYFQLILTATDRSGAAHADRGSPALLAVTDRPAGAGGGFMAQAWDVTTLVERQQELEVHAFRDVLTGVANRRTFMTCLDQQLDSSRRHRQPVAVLFADIDNFKTINDTYGHQSGDRILTEIAARLSSALRPDDILGRIGGDEFAVICPELNGWPAACAVVDRLRAAVSEPIITGRANVSVTVSVGVAFAEEIDERPDEAAHLIALADVRMFREKLGDRSLSQN